MGSRCLTQQFVDGLAWDGTRRFIRDEDVKGLVLVVNRGGSSFVVQRDLWRGPRGRRRLLGTRRVLIGRTNAVSLKEARDRARGVIARMLAGEEPNAAQPTGGVTLRQALASFLDWQVRKNRSPRTVEHNRYTVTRYLEGWLDTPLADIGDDRQGVRDRHIEITEQYGYAVANNAMKSLRAIYRRELRTNPRLPGCPVFSEDFNSD